MSQTDGPKLLLLASRRWAPTSYKWGEMGPYKWPYNWVTKVITLVSGVITPARNFQRKCCIFREVQKGQILYSLPADSSHDPTSSPIVGGHQQLKGSHFWYPTPLPLKPSFLGNFLSGQLDSGAFFCALKNAIFFSPQSWGI